MATHLPVPDPEELRNQAEQIRALADYERSSGGSQQDYDDAIAEAERLEAESAQLEQPQASQPPAPTPAAVPVSPPVQPILAAPTPQPAPTPTPPPVAMPPSQPAPPTPATPAAQTNPPPPPPPVRPRLAPRPQQPLAQTQQQARQGWLSGWMLEIPVVLLVVLGAWWWVGHMSQQEEAVPPSPQPPASTPVAKQEPGPAHKKPSPFHKAKAGKLGITTSQTSQPTADKSAAANGGRKQVNKSVPAAARQGSQEIEALAGQLKQLNEQLANLSDCLNGGCEIEVELPELEVIAEPARQSQQSTGRARPKTDAELNRDFGERVRRGP